MLNQVLHSFQAVSLDDIEDVVSKSRRDIKFILTIEEAKFYLSTHCDGYKILEINDLRSFPYSNQYFDTADFWCYKQHMRDAAPRFKYRIRNYEQIARLVAEVKVKSNKGITTKLKRVVEPSEDHLQALKNMGRESGYDVPESLVDSVLTSYRRSTLINPSGTVRLTVDQDLTLALGEKRQHLDKIVICELKFEDLSEGNRVLRKLLRVGAIRTAFSKYITGCALFVPSLTTSRIRPTLNRIKKLHGLD